MRPIDNNNNNIAVLGCGNLGVSIARGLVNSKLYKPNQITLTKRNIESIESFRQEGYIVTTSNQDAVRQSRIVVVCVTPSQLDDLLESIKSVTTEQHIVISVVSGASIDSIKSHLGNKEIPIVRAMPNTAIQHCESMTCLAVRSSSQKPTNSPQDKAKDFALSIAQKIFNCLGMCIVLTEEQIVPATALCACGIAFFCRAIRAAAQGGCEIGFHAEDAIKIAAQTAKGAATLLLENKFHPEFEIDKVTTPQGCTISGLNQMEHNGFSSAMIKGIVTSAEKAASLYTAKQQKQSNQNQNQQTNNELPPPQQQQQQSPVVEQQQPVEQREHSRERRNNNRTRDNRRNNRNQNQRSVQNQSQSQPETQSESQSEPQPVQNQTQPVQNQTQPAQSQPNQEQAEQNQQRSEQINENGNSRYNQNGRHSQNGNGRNGRGRNDNGRYNQNGRNGGGKNNGRYNQNENQQSQSQENNNNNNNNNENNNNINNNNDNNNNNKNNNNNNNPVDEATQQQEKSSYNQKQQQSRDRKSFSKGSRYEKNQTTTTTTTNEVEAN